MHLCCLCWSFFSPRNTDWLWLSCHYLPWSPDHSGDLHVTLLLPEAAKYTCEEKLAASVTELSCLGDSQCLQHNGQMNQLTQQASSQRSVAWGRCAHSSVLCLPSHPPTTEDCTKQGLPGIYPTAFPSLQEIMCSSRFPVHSPAHLPTKPK